MTVVICDTDFLSSFLKIGRCDLVKSLYQVDVILIPAAVHREIAQTTLLTSLLAKEWIKVTSHELPPEEGLLQDRAFQSLGAGEQSCIQLARGTRGSVLLISDNRARRIAQMLDVTVVNIPAFLLACKMVGLCNSDQMAKIIQDLRDLDFYQFKAEILSELLK